MNILPSKQSEICLGIIGLQIYKDKFVMSTNLKTGPQFADT